LRIGWVSISQLIQEEALSKRTGAHCAQPRHILVTSLINSTTASSHPRPQTKIMIGTKRHKTAVARPGVPKEVEPDLRDLISVIFCVSANSCAETAPVAASSSSSFPIVARMFDERPAGQKTTSKPPPDGMMNVEVWSSNAGERQ